MVHLIPWLPVVGRFVRQLRATLQICRPRPQVHGRGDRTQGPISRGDGDGAGTVESACYTFLLVIGKAVVRRRTHSCKDSSRLAVHAGVPTGRIRLPSLGPRGRNPWQGCAPRLTRSMRADLVGRVRSPFSRSMREKPAVRTRSRFLDRFVHAAKPAVRMRSHLLAVYAGVVGAAKARVLPFSRSMRNAVVEGVPECGAEEATPGHWVGATGLRIAARFCDHSIRAGKAQGAISRLPWGTGARMESRR